MVAQRTRDYELVMVLSPEVTEEGVSVTTDRVDGLITESGGSVSEHENWGLRQLPFRIRQFQEGNYVLTKFASDASTISELNRSLEASEDIIRHLVTRV